MCQTVEPITPQSERKSAQCKRHQKHHRVKELISAQCQWIQKTAQSRDKLKPKATQLNGTIAAQSERLEAHSNLFWLQIKFYHFLKLLI